MTATYREHLAAYRDRLADAMTTSDAADLADDETRANLDTAAAYIRGTADGTSPETMREIAYAYAAGLRDATFTDHAAARAAARIIGRAPGLAERMAPR